VASTHLLTKDVHTNKLDISSTSLQHVQALFTSCELMMMSLYNVHVC